MKLLDRNNIIKYGRIVILVKLITNSFRIFSLNPSCANFTPIKNDLFLKTQRVNFPIFYKETICTIQILE